ALVVQLSQLIEINPFQLVNQFPPLIFGKLIPPSQDVLLTGLAKLLQNIRGNFDHALPIYSELKLEAIISKFAAGRQASIAFLVIEIVTDMGQVGAVGLESLDNLHRLANAEMA